MDWDAVRRRRAIRDAEEAGADAWGPRGATDASRWSRKDFTVPKRVGRPDPWRKRRTEDKGLELGGLVWQVVGAAVLAGGVYVAFQQQGDIPARIQSVAAKALTEQVNWGDVSTWLQDVAESGLTLPVQTGDSRLWSAPLSGTIAEDYRPDQPWVVFEGVPGAAVSAAGKGVVEQVDRKDPYGLYVVVNHGTRGKTLYANLGDVQVKKDDYVYPGQAVGHLSGSRPARLLFGYIVNGQYANPHTVLDGKER